MLKTVPLDLTGTQPRPRQAKAMASSCQLFILLLLFFVFLLLPTPCHLSPNNGNLFTPADLSKTFLCKSNIQTSNICRHIPSPSTSSPTHLLSLLSPPFSWPNTSLKRNVSSLSTWCVDVSLCPRQELHRTHEEWCTYASSQTLTSLSHLCCLFESPPSAGVRW